MIQKKLKEEAEENTPTTTEGSFTILVIDDDPNAQELMKKFLLKENYMVLQATSGHDGLDMAAKHLPDLITLDVMMPEMDGWEVLAALQNNETTKNIPVIMLTLANEPDIGYSLGATDYLTKPVDWGRLSRILEKHEIETSSQSILIVEDDEITREMLKKSLETNEFKVSVAKNGKEGLERVKRAKPALILLDLMMPEMDGFEFAEELRENKEWLDIPVVVITAKDLNSEDHNRLKGNVEAIMQKGSYTKDELLNEVGHRIKKAKRESIIMSKILIVEDNEMNRDMLSRRLMRKGFEIVMAEDGQKGVDMSKSENPDLILMDLSLPVMDGWEATSTIKGDPETNSIPIIVLTAHAMAGDREKALAAGADEYDTKPIEFKRLLGKIKEFLNG